MATAMEFDALKELESEMIATFFRLDRLTEGETRDKLINDKSSFVKLIRDDFRNKSLNTIDYVSLKEKMLSIYQPWSELNKQLDIISLSA